MKKFIICSLLIVLALCQDDSARKTPIHRFIEGIGQSLNIDLGKEISNCFEENQVGIFFNLLQSTTQYVQAIRDGKYNGFMASAVRLWAECTKLEKQMKCVSETKDYRSILKALGYKNENDCEIDRISGLFLESYPSLVTPILETMSQYIEKESYGLAGHVLGTGLIQWNKMETNENSMKTTAFINGIFLRNGVPVPDSVKSRCLDPSKEDVVIHILRFYKDWADALEETKRTDLGRETAKYFLNEGLKHYEDSRKVWECINGSEDNERFRREVSYNLDPYDASFDYDFANFLECPTNRGRYVNLMKNVRKLLDNEPRLRLFAGLNVGTLLKEVSESGIN